MLVVQIFVRQQRTDDWQGLETTDRFTRRRDPALDLRLASGGQPLIALAHHFIHEFGDGLALERRQPT